MLFLSSTSLSPKRIFRQDKAIGNFRRYLMYTDKTLTCKDCGAEFTFTAGEQAFYAEKGFENEPTRCKACRIAKKNAFKRN